MTISEFDEAAREAALKLGPVFPCVPGGKKRPLGQHGNLGSASPVIREENQGPNKFAVNVRRYRGMKGASK
jgi:hypothetical protein